MTHLLRLFLVATLLTGLLAGLCVLAANLGCIGADLATLPRDFREYMRSLEVNERLEQERHALLLRARIQGHVARDILRGRVSVVRAIAVFACVFEQLPSPPPWDRLPGDTRQEKYALYVLRCVKAEEAFHRDRYPREALPAVQEEVERLLARPDAWEIEELDLGDLPEARSQTSDHPWDP
jgi:hypothetical protein